jgi:hypothetical protein
MTVNHFLLDPTVIVASGKYQFYLMALKRAYCDLMPLLSPIKPKVTKPDRA